MKAVCIYYRGDCKKATGKQKYGYTVTAQDYYYSDHSFTSTLPPLTAYNLPKQNLVLNEQQIAENLLRPEIKKYWFHTMNTKESINIE
jgi:hypothetical protein